MTLHLPWPLADGGSSNADKTSSTHPNLIPLDVLNSMRQKEHMRKNPFWYFNSTDCDSSTSNLAVNQNLQITLSWFLLIRFQIWRYIQKALDQESSWWKTHFYILSVIPPKMRVTFHLPRGLKSGPWPRRNFWNMRFHFFT